MAIQTFTRLYDDHDAAAHVVRALEQTGVPQGDISLVASNADARHGVDEAGGAGAMPGSSEPGASAGGGTGATLGTVLGGGAGLLAGLGMLAIPGVGPIVAAGWLVATLTGAGIGAAAGGLLGSLTGAGLSDADAHTYAEGVRRGGSLVTVRGDDTMAGTIDAILDGRTPVDPAARRAEYAKTGWTSFDEAAPAYTAEQVAAERRSRVRVY